MCIWGVCIYVCACLHVCDCRCMQKSEDNFGYRYLPSPLFEKSLVYCCSCKAIWPGNSWGSSCLSPILLDYRCAPLILALGVLSIRILILKLGQHLCSLSIFPAPRASFLSYFLVRYQLPHPLAIPCLWWCSHRQALHFLLSLGSNGCLCSSFLSPADSEVAKVWKFHCFLTRESRWAFQTFSGSGKFPKIPFNRIWILKINKSHLVPGTQVIYLLHVCVDYSKQNEA